MPQGEAIQISNCQRLLQKRLRRPKFTKFQWEEWLMAGSLMTCPAFFSPLAKSERLKVKPDNGRRLRYERLRLCHPAYFVTPDGSTVLGRSCAPVRPLGTPIAGSAGPAVSRKRPTCRGQRQSAHCEDYRLPLPDGARTSFAGTRRLHGCTKGRDARRSQTAHRTADAMDFSRDGTRFSCAPGRAGCPRPFIQEPARCCPDAPCRCRHGLAGPNNKRRSAACRTHDNAMESTRRFAPWRHSLWERKC